MLHHLHYITVHISCTDKIGLVHRLNDTNSTHIMFMSGSIQCWPCTSNQHSKATDSFTCRQSTYANPLAAELRFVRPVSCVRMALHGGPGYVSRSNIHSLDVKHGLNGNSMLAPVAQSSWISAGHCVNVPAFCQNEVNMVTDDCVASQLVDLVCQTEAKCSQLRTAAVSRMIIPVSTKIGGLHQYRLSYHCIVFDDASASALYLPTFT